MQQSISTDKFYHTYVRHVRDTCIHSEAVHVNPALLFIAKKRCQLRTLQILGKDLLRYV
jgi:hypothetical protein